MNRRYHSTGAAQRGAMSPATLHASILLLLLTNAYGGKERPEFSPEIQEIIQHLHNQCRDKTEVAEADIANCENGIFKEDNKLKCYMFCLMEEASLADEEGVIDYDMMVSLIPEQYYDRVSKMIFGCKHLDTPEKDKCQKTFDVHKCSYDKDPDFYFLF
ncbi:hypothetical protein O0L34_g9619 [Tuta absoluta]|nr:hypothetical protein O0L34_g9619 [Tuta absoluta]